MSDILDIKTVTECNCCLGCKTLHPQACVIRLDQSNVEQHSIKFDFYTILLIENDSCDCCCCGRKYYDYSNATMVFLPPDRPFDMAHDKALPQKGWLLAFHPDLLFGTNLSNTIDSYTFFSYNKNEALHLSQREKNTIENCLREMDEELHHPIDKHSKTLITRYIELLLDYCTRFYERQFITRENKNKAIINNTDKLIDEYLTSGRMEKGLCPSPAYCAGKLHLSTSYFCDLLKFETGKTFNEYFQLRRLDISKKMLLQPDCTPSIVASRLGFSSVRYFSLLFKKITGFAPNEYRLSQN